jgi:hypothetical protein
MKSATNPDPTGKVGSEPKALVNAAGSQNRFRTWQAELNGTMSLPRAFRVVPLIRYQSGHSCARTFGQTLNYGNATFP